MSRRNRVRAHRAKELKRNSHLTNSIPYIPILILLHVLLLALLGCDTAVVTKDDEVALPEEPASEYFFGLKVEPSTDALGRSIPFRGVDENGFPLVPVGLRYEPIWTWKVINAAIFDSGEKINSHVIIGKVMIKLWNQGAHDLIGVAREDGKVYPLYRNTIYVRWDEMTDDNGVKKRTCRGTMGDGKMGLITCDHIVTGQVPPEVKVLDYDANGIDPFEFLSEVELNAGCGNEIGGQLVECFAADE